MSVLASISDFSLLKASSIALLAFCFWSAVNCEPLITSCAWARLLLRVFSAVVLAPSSWALLIISLIPGTLLPPLSWSSKPLTVLLIIVSASSFTCLGVLILPLSSVSEILIIWSLALSTSFCTWSFKGFWSAADIPEFSISLLASFCFCSSSAIASFLALTISAFCLASVLTLSIPASPKSTVSLFSATPFSAFWTLVLALSKSAWLAPFAKVTPLILEIALFLAASTCFLSAVIVSAGRPSLFWSDWTNLSISLSAAVAYWLIAAICLFFSARSLVGNFANSTACSASFSISSRLSSADAW